MDGENLLQKVLNWSMGKSDTNTYEVLNKDESRDPMRDRFSMTYFPESDVNTKILDNNFYGNGISGYNSTGAMLSVLHQGIKDKKSLTKKLSTIRNIDYIENILRDLSTDVLTRNYDRSEGEFFIFKTTEEKYEELNEKVNSDIDNLKIYDMTFDFMEDLLFDGQYVLKMDYKNDELDDSLDQSYFMPAFSKSRMVKVFDAERSKLHESSDYLVFNLFTSSKKTRLKSESGSYYYLKLPRGIVPESLISKITNLKLLESLQPLIELQAVDEKMYFHVRFPPGKDASEAYKECRDYERLLKSMLSLEKVNNVDEVIDRISQVKVIPLFGNQESMTSNTVTKINRIELAQLQDLRDAISNSLKVSITGNNSNNPDYYVLVKRLRSFLRISVKDFIAGYIKQKYSIDIPLSSFEITVPEIKGAEELDTIDYLNMHQATYKDILTLITDTSEALEKLTASPFIDKEELINTYSDKLFKLTGSRVFKTFDNLEKAVQDTINQIDDTANVEVEDTDGSEK